jgi:hypothetical protein
MAGRESARIPVSLGKKGEKKPGGLGRAQGLRVLVFRLENPVIQGGFLNG